MSDPVIRSFSAADETIELEGVRSQRVTVGGLLISHDVQLPGFRWSTHLKPKVGTEWCEVHHQGVGLAGHMAGVMKDGAPWAIGPMDVVDIPAGHDAWVVGDEPFEMIQWSGVKSWLAPMASLTDRVVATLVFTDIVDSTGTALRLGDRAWMDVLAAHESRTRDELSRFRGTLVKMTGDGVLAMFDGAARAVRCAVALRFAAATLPIEIRTSVHTGEVERAEDDIHGVAIHEASRVLALAGPGEILVSALTVELARDAGIVFEDRGMHQLRGIAGERRLFAVG